MEEQSRRITNLMSGVTAVTAFVTQPVPALDELVVIPMHYYLVMRLARARGVATLNLPWRNIQSIIWYGAGARLVVNVSFGLVPVAGAVVNSITAIALTEYLGRYMDELLTNPTAVPRALSFAALKELFNRAVQKATESRPEGPGCAAVP
jgi:uncharacterized protein (DUF697 family)